MARRFSTPHELVEALHHHGDGARARLHELLHAPLSRLMEELRVRYGLRYKGEALTRHALHAAETYLRTCPSSLFAHSSWAAFRAAVLLHVAKLASQPFGEPSAGRALPGPLPRSPRYHCEAFFQPCERVGDYWFGGDWFGGRESADGSLWVLLADITGHGYFAYLMASALPGVWQYGWEAAPHTPSDLLAAMHDLLTECLPEGIYVECTLVRLHPEGEVVAAPAGGSRLLLRRGGEGRPVLVKMRGAWLGLLRPTPGDEQRWALGHGDELLLATDGVFDQLYEHTAADFVETVGPLAHGAGLFERVRGLLDEALQRTPQKDDITLLVLRRRGASEPEA